MPRDALARRFGESVAQRLDQALGRLPEPLSPLERAPVRRVRLSFAEPIAEPADLARASIGWPKTGARLAREGVGARRLDLAFHRVDGRSSISASAPHGRAAMPAISPALLPPNLETIDPGLGVEDMILALIGPSRWPSNRRVLSRHRREAEPGWRP